MARLYSQTLIRSFIPCLLSSTSRYGGVARLASSIQYSTQSKFSGSRFSSEGLESVVAEREAMAVRGIEDAIHGIVVKKLTPDWLPFVPGASFWVPPKRRYNGIAEMVHKITYSTAFSDDEVMSLVTFFGWPSFDFFIQDQSSDQTSGEETSKPPPRIMNEQAK